MDFRQLQLAFTAVKIGLPKALGHDRKTAEQLSADLKIPGDRLIRLLRGLVWSGVLSIDDAACFELTESGQALLDDGKALGLRFEGELFYRAWGELSEYIRSGVTPFESAHGVGVFEYIQRDPALADLYSAPMAQRSTEYSHLLAAHPQIKAAHSIVDVAGGTGRLLADLLKHNQQASGVIFDLPVMQTKAVQLIADEGLQSRCRFEGGDMFVRVPEGADVYLLKWVLHDWDDKKAIQILARCRDAMRGDAKLVVIERLMPEDPREAARSGLVMADLNMLCQSGGVERTLTGYNALAETAGLRLIACDRVEQHYGFHAIVYTIKH